MLATTTFLTGMILPATAAPPGSAQPGCWPVVELRQYTLHPQRLDTFIEMFEREFIETQEAVGISVIGHFRDLDDPNRFVWLRGFADMPARAQALQAFYGGPVWKAHRDEANANFIDTDNVLLLRPVSAPSQVTLDGARPSIGTLTPGTGLVVATIYYLDAPVSADFIAFFANQVRPEMRRSGISVAAEFATEPKPNNFPRLPVREGENVFLWIAAFAAPESYPAAATRLENSQVWRQTIAPELARRLKSSPQVLRLAPAPRSLLHG